VAVVERSVEPYNPKKSTGSGWSPNYLFWFRSLRKPETLSGSPRRKRPEKFLAALSLRPLRCCVQQICTLKRLPPTEHRIDVVKTLPMGSVLAPKRLQAPRKPHAEV
jgi:hypothetical protein